MRLIGPIEFMHRVVLPPAGVFIALIGCLGVIAVVAKYS